MKLKKFKELKKIEKIQFIVTLFVAIACLFGSVYFLFIRKPKPNEEAITLEYTYIEPNYLGSVTMDTTRLLSYNGSYANNFAVVGCFRTTTDFGYYTMPFNLNVAFRDMISELNSLGLDLPLASYKCWSFAENTTEALTNAQITSYLQDYCKQLASGYLTPVYEKNNLALSDVSSNFTNNTKLLALQGDINLDYDFSYVYIGLAVSFNTNNADVLSSVLPYSDSVTCDTFLFNYTEDNLQEMFDFSNNYWDGFHEGFRQGKIEGANINYSSNATGIIATMMAFIFNGPINFIKNAFDVDFLGINIAGVFLGLISVLLVGWLIKKLV